MNNNDWIISKPVELEGQRVRITFMMSAEYRAKIKEMAREIAEGIKQHGIVRPTDDLETWYQFHHG